MEGRRGKLGGKNTEDFNGAWMRDVEKQIETKIRRNIIEALGGK